MTVTAANSGPAIYVKATGGQACLTTICGPNAGGNGAYVTATVSGSVTTSATRKSPNTVLAGNYAAPAILINTSGGNGGYGHIYNDIGDIKTVGSGGNAGGISLTIAPLSTAAPSIVISSLGTAAYSPAVALIANGGNGGDGYTPDTTFQHQSNSGAGGNAGNITFTAYSTSATAPIIISTAGDHSAGILAQSIAGAGGYGGFAAAGTTPLADGGNGGAAGVITIRTNANITTAGTYSPGIRAISAGGNGGDSGSGNSVTAGNGGTGLTTDFAISVTSRGAITTKGAYSSGIYATSIGGTGGNVLGTSGLGTAGAGAPSGEVSVQNFGTIVTSGDESHGIIATSFGGGGGAGGSTSPTGAILIFATGGQGANGAKGGYTYIANSGSILTSGDSSNGIFAFSEGGGGGLGGSVRATTLSGFSVPSVSVTLGGEGGTGGEGGDLTINNQLGGNISTSGRDSAAIRALTVGGNGGAGGQSNSSTYTAGFGPSQTQVSFDINIAGKGGGGGNGGTANVNNTGALSTSGDQSPGIQITNVGGGGGEGGNAQTQDLALGISKSVIIAVTVGGGGGSGGDGGTIKAYNNTAAATITTTGFASHGISAVSIGGGGGNGGIGSSQIQTVIPLDQVVSALPIAFNESYQVNLALGGSGGSGGNGGNLTASNDAKIQTSGIDAVGIFALSVGGGGGVAAAGKAVSSADYSDQLTLGGNGGSGGSGTTVTVTNSTTGTIQTSADGAHGIVAASIGGGGGNAGTSSADLSNTAAEAGEDGLSQATLTALLNSMKEEVGQKPEEWEPTANLQVSLGGKGGGGGNGGQVSVSNAGTITTGAAGGSGGHVAFGILAQSVGGGGGVGGAASSYGSQVVNAIFSMGGAGGAAGSGGTVTVINSGTITTNGDSAFGILAQSVGGGGGIGGLGSDLSPTLLGPTVTLGGETSTGANSGGGTVNVTAGQITTHGNESHAVVAQSIGGGGGLFFANQADYTNAGQLAYQQELGQQVVDILGQDTIDQLASDFAQASANSSGTLTLTIGGTQQAGSATNNAGGSGGAVNVTLTSAVQTTGANAFGVLAQSIGGGGGFATDGSGLDVNTLTVKGSLGNTSGGNLVENGGAVSVTFEAGSSISTTGNGATAVVAQSIGGGGGYTGAIDAASGMSYANFLTPSDVSLVVNANMAGGDVTVTSNGIASISTTGANAHGIVAQSLSGGGGLVGDSGGIIIPTGPTTGARVAGVQGALNPGDVSINYTGTIETTGANAIAIFAQSGIQSTSGLIDTTQAAATSGSISVTIGDNSTITGGGGTGAAIVLDGLATNTITVGAGATVSAASGLAVSSLWGSNTLTNSGTIIGDVFLANGTSGPAATFLNQNGGTYVTNVSGTIDLGTAGTLNNQGTINVAGSGTFGSATLTGTLFQAGGTLAVDVGGTSTSDVFNAAAVSKASGQLQVSVVGSLDPSGQYTVMTVCGNNPVNCNSPLEISGVLQQMQVTNNSASGISVSWDTSASTATALIISPDVTFAPAGLQLNANQKAYAQHLQATWNAGGSDGLSPVYADLINLPGIGAYQRALGTAIPAMLAAGPAASVGSSRSALGSVLSCPEFEGAGDVAPNFYPAVSSLWRWGLACSAV
ncbi:hypothetical protein ABLE93_08765 [Xanthobacter sp. KR7-65]|uniref:beta strand repeat-containing protein n=1 Tax=Xanthobacter sp. KR7-65 TaxID=3156612 RepID=UPI0032B5FAAB